MKDTDITNHEYSTLFQRNEELKASIWVITLKHLKVLVYKEQGARPKAFIAKDL